jgi:coatomer protein complex subunit epsilon
VGKAVARIHAGKFEEAEELLLESLNKNSSDPETLINLIVCGRATGKPADVVSRFLELSLVTYFFFTQHLMIRPVVN